MTSSSTAPALAPPIDIGDLTRGHSESVDNVVQPHGSRDAVQAGSQRPTAGGPIPVQQAYAPSSQLPPSAHHAHSQANFLPGSTFDLISNKSLTVTAAYARAVNDHAQHGERAPEIGKVARDLFARHVKEDGADSGDVMPAQDPTTETQDEQEVEHTSKLGGILAKLHLGSHKSTSTPTEASDIVGAHPSSPTTTTSTDPSDRKHALPDHHEHQGHFHHSKKHGYDLVYPKGTELGEGDLQRTAKAGGWVRAATGQAGTTTTSSPSASDLFLQIVTHALAPLTTHPLAGLCSPSLLLSTAIIPLTIISTIPDIIHHHVNVIVKAKREVFLATNFWEASGNAGKVVEGLKELSRRVVERGGERVVVKIMYDRGNPKQLIKPHQLVPPSVYTATKVRLPEPSSVPGIQLEVVNYHDPPVGTFHAKYMVVDREVAILNSNNIQDRVNVEMMTHIEGPVVQSLYDMALLSWSLAMDPPLPLLSAHLPSGNDRAGPLPSGGAQSNGAQTGGGVDNATASRSSATPPGGHPAWDDTNELEVQRQNAGMTTMGGITQRLNTGTKLSANSTLDTSTLPFTPIHLHAPHAPVPCMLVNRPPHGIPGHGSTFVPQDQAWLAALKYARHKVVIQTPTFNAWPVVEAVLDAVKRGIVVDILADLGFNDEGELLPFQGGTNEMVSTEMYKRLETEDQKDRLRFFWYTGKDQDRPVNATGKSRNCHVKLMIVDGHVGIQGNGNMDAQSWFHSQEINIMIDSEQICADWQRMLESNENTYQRGALSKDGLWRDANTGERLADKEDPAPPKGPMKSLQGVKGAIQRVRGEGGFAT